ncbi:multifunctional methyltransferase subunit TRM112-like protein [Symsagittifera roscoffensis]|uniref:multifunctional methyltransferase subunit TRM112-like protein n=1 Tax=Symsagittifera roscoffensis TaxID=84072 RepID=UPI00307C6A81
MKLLTHNLMQSHVKGVKNGYPFKLEVTIKKINDIDFNPDFVTRMMEKIDWKVLKEAAEQCYSTEIESGEEMNPKVKLLPDEPPQNINDSGDSEYSEDFLRLVHHALMEIEVQEGFLVCPESGRKFKVTRGIPNMLLTEQETK